MAIILGIDPSLSHTGLVVFDTTTWQIKYQTAITNPPGSSANYAMAPYDQIKGGISMVIREYGVEHAFIEKMFVGANGSTVELLFCAAFTARQTCHELGVPYHIIPVNGEGKGWRWFTLGVAYTTYKGNQAKIANKSRLMSDLGQKLNNEHTADAAGIALAGWYFTHNEDFRDALGVQKPNYIKEETPRASKPAPRKKAAARA